jgi:hypothetical protein
MAFLFFGPNNYLAEASHDGFNDAALRDLSGAFLCSRTRHVYCRAVLGLECDAFLHQWRFG